MRKKIPKPKHAGGRPPKKPEDRRVQLAARVTPATAALYADVAPYHGGVGKAIDTLSGLGMEYLRVLYAAGKVKLPDGHPATRTPPIPKHGAPVTRRKSGKG